MSDRCRWQESEFIQLKTDKSTYREMNRYIDDTQNQYVHSLHRCIQFLLHFDVTFHPPAFHSRCRRAGLLVGILFVLHGGMGI